MAAPGVFAPLMAGQGHPHPQAPGEVCPSTHFSEETPLLSLWDEARDNGRQEPPSSRGVLDAALHLPPNGPAFPAAPPPCAQTLLRSRALLPPPCPRLRLCVCSVCRGHAHVSPGEPLSLSMGPLSAPAPRPVCLSGPGGWTSCPLALPGQGPSRPPRPTMHLGASGTCGEPSHGGVLVLEPSRLLGVSA